MHPFAHLFIVLITYGFTVLEQYVIEFPGLPYFWGYFIKPCCFSIFNFSEFFFLNDEYENFINTHLEAAAECIQIKQRAKPRVLWEALAVRTKQAHMKTASKGNRKNPTNINTMKLKKAQNELDNIYLKEQTENIQNEIRDLIEDRQSRIVWQMVNEVIRRKSTAKAKLKATSQEERMQLWKQHLLGNPPKVTHEPITRIIRKQLDIKLRKFTQEEHTYITSHNYLAILKNFFSHPKSVIFNETC